MGIISIISLLGILIAICCFCICYKCYLKKIISHNFMSNDFILGAKYKKEKEKEKENTNYKIATYKMYYNNDKETDIYYNNLFSDKV